MAKRERMRRPDPPRTAPIRRFSTMFRRNDGEFKGAPGSISDDDISGAVNMGYSVIGDHIRQGQRAAQSRWSANAGFQGAPGGVPGAAGLGGITDIANRLLQYSTDLAALHFDLMTALLHSPGLHSFTASFAPTQHDGSRVVVEIESQRKNRVTVDLWPGSDKAQLTVPALHAAESDKDPVTDIVFFPASEQSPARLCITIPADQPAGVYTGLILQAETGQACGTLSLRLHE